MVDRPRDIAIELPDPVTEPRGALTQLPPFEPWRATWNGLSYEERQALARLEAPYRLTTYAVAGRDRRRRLMPDSERIDCLNAAGQEVRPYFWELIARIGEFEHETCSPAIGVINCLRFHAVPVAAQLARLTPERFLNPSLMPQRSSS